MDHSRLAAEAFDRIAGLYRDKFMDLDLYDDTFAVFCSMVEKRGARIFEVGCGPGNITRYVLTKRPDFKILATDLAPNMISLAKEINPAADFMVMDCREIGHMKEKFDGIVCGFCMPYLSKTECAQLIFDCANLLNAGGIFYFSLIEDRYDRSGYETSSNGKESLFVYYHEEDYLRKSLSENNFELADLGRKKYTRADGTENTHLVIIAKKLKGAD